MSGLYITYAPKTPSSVLWYGPPCNGNKIINNIYLVKFTISHYTLELKKKITYLIYCRQKESKEKKLNFHAIDVEQNIFGWTVISWTVNKYIFNYIPF